MLQIGQLVDGKYKVLNQVGRGGMSIVYLAMNEKANKQWAIKEVRKDGVKDFEVVKQNLIVETDLLKKLSHPHLPSIIDVIEQDDTFLIVMDYIEGNPLSKLLYEYGAQPQDKVIAWAKQLCDVLGYLHSRTPAIIYRDMKPANVMLKPDGNVTLIDFGTAREFKEKNVEDTTCLGTIGYAAPEQFGGMGQTDARTDIYCLGATLYHLVTGMNPCEPPYEIRPIRTINPSLSSGLEKIISKCTQRDPKDRYQSTAELMYDLENYDKIDKLFINKQKKRVAAFAATSFLTVAMGVTSVFAYYAAESKMGENYEERIRIAQNTEDYFQAIQLQPSRIEAYEAFVEYVLADAAVSPEEKAAIDELEIGINSTDEKNGDGTINVLEDLKRENQDKYIDLCYSLGEAVLLYYDTTETLTKYQGASFWFKESKNKYPIAELYCDIYSCLASVKRYENSVVNQEEEKYEEYKNLWTKLVSLREKSAQIEKIGHRIQAWDEINTLVNEEAKDFVLICKQENILELLNAILEDAAGIEESIYSETISQITNAINETIKKINVAYENRERMSGL